MNMPLERIQQSRLRQASIEFDRLHFHELVAQQLANHRKRPKLPADAHARISQWECDGLCWSGYVVAWKSILALPLPQLKSASLAVTSRTLEGALASDSIQSWCDGIFSLAK